jgi:formylglycine-generating enzyme required for sulfatase activity
MIAVPKPTSGSYCVDATEVSQAEYAAWLQSNPPTTGQTAMCVSNATFQPATINNSCTATTYAPSATPNTPVVCIDWCDAAAYCKARDKRLCGSVAGGGVAQPSLNDAAVSQWYRACTAAGTRTLPYGSTYTATACNGADRSNVTVDVGSLSTCVGGYAGLSDMSGNVAEWEDACKAAGNPRCQIRGGSFKDHETGLVCSSNTQAAYDLAAAHVGFRCCSD